MRIILLAFTAIILSACGVYEPDINQSTSDPSEKKLYFSNMVYIPIEEGGLEELLKEINAWIADNDEVQVIDTEIVMASYDVAKETIIISGAYIVFKRE